MSHEHSTTIEKDFYKEIKGVISKEMCRVAAREFEMVRDLNLYTAENPNLILTKGDGMANNSFCWYSPLVFESLSDTIIKDAIEKEIGEAVYPTYTYARIYYKGSKMDRHIDRGSSEISASLCIKVDPNYPWHLGVKTLENKEKYIVQEPGDIVIYKGDKLEHWRDTYEGTEQINAFFFFVKANSPRGVLKYDTRPLLGMDTGSRKWDSEKQNKLFPPDGEL